MKNDKLEIFKMYANALENGDFEKAFEVIDDNIIWHMNGDNLLSGTIVGKKNLIERLGEFAKKSNNTFKVKINWAANNGDFVAASVISLAEKNDNKLNNPGIDLFKIKDSKIKEVWTFSEYQKIEDEFWGKK